MIKTNRQSTYKLRYFLGMLHTVDMDDMQRYTWLQRWLRATVKERNNLEHNLLVLIEEQTEGAKNYD